MSEEIARAVVRIEPDTTGFREETRAQVDEATFGETAKIRISLDSGGTRTELAAIELAAKDAASAIGGGAGGGSSGLVGAMSSAGAESSSFASALSPTVGVLAALSPLLAPVAGSVITGVVGLGSAFTAAGAGALGFGAVVKTVLDEAQQANQKLDAAQQAVNNATTTASRQKALEEQKRLIDSIPPSVAALGNALRDVEGEWKAFANAFSPQVLELVQTAVSGLGKILPELAPVVAEGASALNVVAKEFTAALTSPSGKAFFTWLADEAGPTILHFADTFLQLGHAAASIFEAFTPLTNELVSDIDRGAAELAKWADSLSSSKGFGQFVDYMQKNGPLLVHTIGDIGKTIAQVVIDLAPLAPPMLMFIDDTAKLADVISKDLAPPLEWFGNWLAKNPAVIQLAADSLAGLYGYLAGLAGGFTQLEHDAGQAVGFLANLLADFAQGALGAFGDILHGASDAFGWVPGLGSGLHDAERAFDNFAATAVNDLRNVAAAADALGTSLAASGINTTGSATAAEFAQQHPNAGTAAGDFQSLFTQFQQEMQNFKLPTLDLSGGGSGGFGSGVLPALPLSGGSTGSKAAQTAAQNNAAALAYLLGISVPNSLAQGIAAGTNPLTQTFQNLNQKLTGTAQTLANTLESTFNSALSYGQKAAATLEPNIISGLPSMGTQTLVTVDPKTGKLTSTVQSPILGGLQSVLGTDQRFVADINKAKQLGLSSTLLDQFVQAGPSSLSQLDQLVNGSAGDIAHINATYGQITGLANAYGYQAAANQYLSQVVGELQQLIAAVKAQAPQLAAALNGTAKNGMQQAAATPSLGMFSRG